MVQCRNWILTLHNVHYRRYTENSLLYCAPCVGYFVLPLLVASSIGFLAIPANADPIPNKVLMSFDYSDNTAPASASSGSFNIIVDVLPGGATGLVRMFAVAPDSTNDSNIVCHFQWINQSQVECAFNFPDPGVWAIHAQYVVVPQTDVVAVAVTNLRVLN